MAILSVLTPDGLATAIMAGDRARRGPRRRCRAEAGGSASSTNLKDKVGALPAGGGGAMPSGMAAIGTDDGAGADAMSALVNLGYGRAEAHAALQRARAGGADDGDLSGLIAAALQEMGR